mmetsp:Transcript_43946/g.140005  ORF Transcript_43946/g.140005 Transcript_43946/m.140005 type:complete len:614 (-) Transcript_43946:246-2087(-)
MVDFIRAVSIVVAVASLSASQGLALLLYIRGLLLLPLLICLSNVVGVLASQFTEWKLLTMVPVMTSVTLAAVVWPSMLTYSTLLAYACFWAFAYKHVGWLIDMGIRKEHAELVDKCRMFLYHTMDYCSYASSSMPQGAPKRPGTGQVTVVRTSKISGERLSELPPLLLETGEPRKGEPNIVLNPDVRFQTFMGFGGAFTESSAELLQQMGSANQERIIDAYFRAGTGLGYQIGRLHMNSCDFSRGNWSCCEKADDQELESFTIEHYQQAVLPMVRRACAAAGRSLRLFASPWSPPAWMKGTDRMLNGGKLKPECRDLWAKCYVKFARSLQEAGFPLWGFTVQNEPDADNAWENCLFDPAEERDFIRDHLGPAIDSSGMDLKLIAWDHNRDDLYLRAHTIYSDSDAAKYVWGMGWHWYGDPRYEFWADANDQTCFENVRLVHELCPHKHLWVTEVCQELGSHIGDWGVGERYAESIIRDFNNWCEAWVDWNLILDQDGGHNHVGNRCSAPIIADPSKDRVLLQPSYYYLGHFSRHIQVGAQRILCAPTRGALEATAFANPDGTLVVVVLNQTRRSCSFCLKLASMVTRYTAEPHSISTLALLADSASETAAPAT